MLMLIVRGYHALCDENTVRGCRVGEEAPFQRDASKLKVDRETMANLSFLFLARVLVPPNTASYSFLFLPKAGDWVSKKLQSQRMMSGIGTKESGVEIVGARRPTVRGVAGALWRPLTAVERADLESCWGSDGHVPLHPATECGYIQGKTFHL